MNTRHRGAGRLVPAAVLVVLIATLTPASTNVPTSGPWCLLCGQAGTIDALQNVVLFLPLGFGLARRGWSRAATVGAAVALTAFVETMQFTLIPGRDASLGDLLFNTVGGALGFALQRADTDLLRPARRAAITLRGAAGAAWILALPVATFGLLPASPPGHPDQWTLTAPFDSADARYFSGTVRAIHVNGVRWLVSGPSTMGQIRSELGARPATIAMEIRPGRPTSEYATIFAVHAGKVHPFSFGQSGRDLLCQRFLAGSAILLRTPVFVLPDAFPSAAPPADEPGDPYVLQCSWIEGHLIVRRSSTVSSAAVSVPLTPGLGWTLFIPAVLGASEPLTRSLTFFWLLFIGTPLGYWMRMPPRPDASPAVSPIRTLASGWGAAPLVLLALLLTQRIVPAIAGTAPSPLEEYLATGFGFMLGMGLAHLMRSRQPSTIGS